MQWSISFFYKGRKKEQSSLSMDHVYSNKNKNTMLWISEDHTRGLSSFTILAGCGGTVGYCLGSVDWNNFFVGKILFNNLILRKMMSHCAENFQFIW